MKKIKIANDTNTNKELPAAWQAQAETKKQPKPKIKKNKYWWKEKKEDGTYLTDEEINKQLDKGFDYTSKRRTEATAFRYRKMVKGQKYEVYSGSLVKT